ncbi:MAG TPA: antibiotic biosynthesis monooxygenase [Ilumatobacteraceae bacterium]|nr:antibiotic biosynthesis monooxygenase [Ilumatobacteraceae bacterium]
MSLIVVEAAIRLTDASKRHDLITQTAPIQQATRDEEPGCLVYCFAEDPCEEDLIQVYELWESEETLEVHLDHPNYWNMRNTLGAGGIADVVHRKHRIDATAAVYNAEGKANASFD